MLLYLAMLASSAPEVLSECRVADEHRRLAFVVGRGGAVGMVFTPKELCKIGVEKLW